jgi:hypothetical protein
MNAILGNMTPLPINLVINGFNYHQVVREGDVAIYSQEGFAYEVIIVQRHNGYTAFGKTYPPAEYYPKNEDWGKKAWTISGGDDVLHRAKVKMREVIEAREAKAAKKKAKDTSI